MKIFDQLLLQDKKMLTISILMIVLAIVLISTMIYRFLKDRSIKDQKSSISTKIINYVVPSIVSLVLILVGSLQISSTSLTQQVSKSIDVDYFNLSALVHVESGEDVRYKFDAASNEYSSTNNALMKGINEVMGRYDFESIESIEEIGDHV